MNLGPNALDDATLFSGGKSGVTIHAPLKVEGPITFGQGGTGGSFTLNGVTPVVEANTNITANSVVIPTLKTVGGTVGALPSVKTITPGVGFTVAGTAADTSIYNYIIIESA